MIQIKGEKKSESFGCPVLSDSWNSIDCSLPGSCLAPANSSWNCPGKNTGVSSYSFLQGIFPNQGSNSGLLHCRQTTILATREAPSVPDLFRFKRNTVLIYCRVSQSQQYWHFEPDKCISPPPHLLWQSKCHQMSFEGRVLSFHLKTIDLKWQMVESIILSKSFILPIGI